MVSDRPDIGNTWDSRWFAESRDISRFLRNMWRDTGLAQVGDELEGYDDLAAAIVQAADALPTHSSPLEDAKLHLRCLIACAQEVMAAYEAHKKALGLIDFADMIKWAGRLLRADPAVRQAVLDEIDCVIIDEFQDANPVQFALLW